MGGRARRRIARESMDFAKQQVAAYKQEQAIQRNILEKQKEEYKQFEFVNPYRDLQNYYEDMENVFEDLTVDTQAADFQMERGEQQRANILQALRGAAGGSGIANLAQSLANQGVIQAAQVSANIAQQERQNQVLAARAASQIQTAERRGMAGANAGLQAAYANQMGAFGLDAQMLGAQMGMYGQIIGGIAQGGGSIGAAMV